MKLAVAIIISAVLAAVIASMATFNMTKNKWYALGLENGKTTAETKIMDSLCVIATKSAPTAKAVYYLDVKASRLSVVKARGNMVALYCE